MFGLLKKFKSGFARTTQSLFGAVGGIFGAKKLDAATLDTLEEALYGADFGVETTEEIMDEIQAAFKNDKELRGLDAAEIGAQVLLRVLDGAEGKFESREADPEVILLLGVNGSGKTTTTAKLGHLYEGDGRSVLLAACDTFRAAANEQIKSWSERLNIDLIASKLGADAAAVAFDAYQAAESRQHDLIIIDTAGRLHNKPHLMGELEKIVRVLKKKDESAPHHRWLVVDGSLGSNSIEQARSFHKAINLTGLVITKLDGTSRGGALVGIYRELKIPIYFVGLGEQPDDLQPFTIENYVSALFGLRQEVTE
ncbi:MAG: signal recognition particle-docking protein FtsY [Verrucomicrobia bacterium]|nr:signal recognition particle-docking protein FtsY [Verrucomicrobiota bacterium]